MNSNAIEFHADDYGLFPGQSRRIIACCEEGALNGVSLMPNSPYLEECMEMLKPYMHRLALSVHLNLVEGVCMDGSALTKKCLTDEKGIFRAGFLKLFLVSYVPFLRGRYREALRRELKAQIMNCLPYYELEHEDRLDTFGDPGGIRLDGHLHYHMIPVVFDAMMDVIAENKLRVSYIRIPEEKIGLYKNESGKITGLVPVNILKVVILNILALRSRVKYRSFFKGSKSCVFSGVLLSGHMSFENIGAYLENVSGYVSEKGAFAEILFHPGSVVEEEDVNALTSKADLHFLSEGREWRKKEAQALVRIKDLM